eukprot:m.1037950 g.1037950  ORF g.1037950 m.1037950 type:complete len:469 (+) comp24146_c1_seq8:217-1623(+)
MDTVDPTPPKKPVSFGFQIKAKSTKPRADVSGGIFSAAQTEQPKDFVTSLDDNEITSTGAALPKKELVIPLQKVVKWRSTETPTGEAVKSDHGGTDNAAKTSPNTGSDENVLSLEERAVAALQNEAEKLLSNDPSKDQIDAIPILMQNRVPGYDDAVDDKEKYKRDVALRPDESTMEDYDNTRVEDFGAALLRGMGWNEGQAIGQSNKGLLQPIVAIPRPQRLGLGATRNKELKPDARGPKKYVKPGESRDRERKELVAAGTSQVRHMRGIDDKLVEKEDVSIKKDAYVVLLEGAHKGLCGKIRRFKGDRIEVELSLGSDANIKVYEDQLRAISREEYKSLKAQRGSRATSGSSKSGKHHLDTESQDHKRQRVVPWLTRNIRVRVISDKYMKGRYYNKKVRITNVLTPTTCECCTDDGKLLEGTVLFGFGADMRSPGVTVQVIAPFPTQSTTVAFTSAFMSLCFIFQY